MAEGFNNGGVGANGLSDDQWRSVLELSEAAAEIPEKERLSFLESNTASPEIIREVLALAGEFTVAQPLDRLGTRVGRFVVTGAIGRGGMGEVYTARDTQLERIVALKFLNPDMPGLAGGVDSFIREARTASALNHPNIITIHEVIHTGSTVAIVMEYVSGTPLRQLCGSPLSAAQMIPVGRQIALALAAAHTEGIVHRDVKPENAIWRRDGSIKVLDFGLALRATPEHRDSDGSLGGGFAGTWRYMSPEQAHGDAVTSATDIFSLGLVLYELLAGTHPFPADSAFGALDAIEKGSPKALPDSNLVVSAQLNALVFAMLAKEPAERPTAEIVAQRLSQMEWDLRAALAVRPAHPMVLAAWTFAALLAIAALGLWLRHRAAPRQSDFYQVTTLVPENRATAAAISPDGTSTAFANVDGIFLRAAETGQLTALQGPPDFVVDKLSWFADRKRLVVSGFSSVTNDPAIWTVSVTGAAAQKVSGLGNEAVPSPDGRQIALITHDQEAVWVTGAGGEQPHKVITGGPGDSFLLVLWSPDGRRLSFQRRHYSGTQDLGTVMRDRYYQRSYESIDLQSGRVTGRVPELWINSAALLPDGRLLFLRWDPPGSDYSDELWEAQTDPATGEFRGKARKVASPIAGSPDHVYGMSSSQNGKQVMVLRRSDSNTVFVADFEHSPPHLAHSRRLTLDERTDYPHAWTADSRSVIFESDRNGGWNIFKQRVDQHTPDTIAATNGRADVLPQLSPDGQWVMYAEGAPGGLLGDYTLMRVPVSGGTPEGVPIGGPLDEFRCAVGAGTRCVLRTTVGRRYRVFYDLDPIHGKGRELARTAWMPGLLWDWDVSSDGSQVAIPNHSPSSARIRVVPLDRSGGAKEHDIVLAGVTDLSGLVSAAGNQGWFVSVVTPLRDRLLFAYPDGKWRTLAGLQGWVVPSPDGRRVAFRDHTIATNAWIIKLQ